MAKLTLDLVDGGVIAFDTQKDFIEIWYESTPPKVKTKLGLLRRADYSFLHSFLRSSISSLPSLSDEMQAKFMEMMGPFLEQMRRLTEGEQPPPSEEN